jgi:hypothetical protein
MWVFEDLDLSLVEALWRTKSQFDNLMLRDKRQRLSTKRQHLAERENTIRHRGDVCGNKLSLKGGLHSTLCWLLPWSIRSITLCSHTPGLLHNTVGAVQL